MSSTAQAHEADHIQDQLCQRIEDLETEKLALIDENERLRRQARSCSDERPCIPCHTDNEPCAQQLRPAEDDPSDGA